MSDITRSTRRGVSSCLVASLPALVLYLSLYRLHAMFAHPYQSLQSALLAIPFPFRLLRLTLSFSFASLLSRHLPRFAGK